MKKHSVKRVILKILIVICALVFAFSAFMIYRYYNDGNKSKQQFESLSQMLPEVQKGEAADSRTASERYSVLYGQNSDFIGWVKIVGTTLDYPVMQTRDNEEYYLRRGFDKNYNYHGTPFIDADSVVGVSDNIIIYGHNMLDNTMFAALEKYKSKSYYLEHKHIQFDTLWEYGTYEIIAVIRSTPKMEKEFKYYGLTNAWSEEHFNEYISGVKENALYSTDSTAQYGDKLLTLSTCEYTVDGGRLAVIAKKIER